MRPRTKPPEQRRADLLDAAERIALDKGVEGITVDEVTAGAGVSKGSFYLHFRSKDHVLDALRERYVERFLARQAAAVAGAAGADPDDWAGRVEAWAVAGIEDYVEDPRLHDVVFRHSQPPPRIDPEQPTPIIELQALLEEAVAAGALAIRDPHATAVVIYHAVHGTSDHLIHAGDPTAPERLIAEVRRLCRALLDA
ncbi:TetR/AcrR family transcriptional regulator [Spirillospora sp. CA-294931]|uniref:TetR/AcrR family transcriptional regulator n=1 Tax=Spirillospora sp. CA-294931 TaxID=3240042 RepID=UPI003D8BFE11